MNNRTVREEGLFLWKGYYTGGGTRTSESQSRHDLTFGGSELDDFLPQPDRERSSIARAEPGTDIGGASLDRPLPLEAVAYRPLHTQRSGVSSQRRVSPQRHLKPTACPMCKQSYSPIA